jgi:hypothetical protein
LRWQAAALLASFCLVVGLILGLVLGIAIGKSGERPGAADGQGRPVKLAQQAPVSPATPSNVARIGGCLVSVASGAVSQGVIDHPSQIILKMKVVNATAAKKKIPYRDLWVIQLSDELGNRFAGTSEITRNDEWEIPPGETYFTTYFSPAHLGKGKQLIFTWPNGAKIVLDQQQIPR